MVYPKYGEAKNLFLKYSEMVHLDKLSAISFLTPIMCTVFKNMSNWAAVMNILRAMAASLRSRVLPELRTMTTAWLSHAILTAFPLQLAPH